METGEAIAEPRVRATGTAEPVSFAKALEILRMLKATGQSWTEMSEEIQQRFGVQLDKDQLKALVR